MRFRPPLYLLAGLTALILSCYLVPNVLFRLTHDGWPIGDPNRYRYAAGMTKEEVRAILGKPHHRCDEDDGEKWHYHCDAFGFAILSIKFDREGRMVRDWW